MVGKPGTPLRHTLPVAAVAAVLLWPALGAPYPPAVGILGNSRSCADCHASNGPWRDDVATIVDILDASTRRSLRQTAGRFLIEVPRGQTRTVVTVIGRAQGDSIPPPTRNAWLYVDPAAIANTALSKFAPGWDVNLPMSCRLVGDRIAEYPGASVTALPMTVRAGDAARDAELELQVLLTTGGPGKGTPDDWLRSTFLIRKVRLDVTDP